jgi:beta-mannosidase
VSGSLRLTLVRNGNTRVAQESLPVTVAAGATRTVASASIMRGFFDITHSYKFGPPAQDLAQVEFFDDDGRLVCDNTYFHDGREVFSHPDTEVDVVSREVAVGEIELEISSSHFLYRVCLDAPGYLPEDNYFNLMPGASRVIRMRPADDCNGRFRGYLGALNLDQELRIA